MLKTIDISVAKPSECPFRHYMYLEEFDTDAFNCHDLSNEIRDRLIPCNNREAFPKGCPLSKNNINVWRDR
jgi:hypothetical protein